MTILNRAFTMIELVLVIVIIGLLALAASMLLPNYTLLNDTNFVAMEIKRTQAKAIGNSKFSFTNANWANTPDNERCIVINKASLNVPKAATGGYSMHQNTTLVVNPALTADTLCFDHIGRAYNGNFQNANRLVNSVVVTLSYRSEDRNITIVPFSGYVMY